MKLIAMLGAGALAAGMLGAVPAEAQRYGYGYDRGSHGYGDRGYNRGFRDHGYRGGNRYAYRGGRHGFRGDYGYRGPRGYRGYGGGYYRPRVVCRLRPGYYGPVRRCFRVY